MSSFSAMRSRHLTQNVFDTDRFAETWTLKKADGTESEFTALARSEVPKEIDASRAGDRRVKTLTVLGDWDGKRGDVVERESADWIVVRVGEVEAGCRRVRISRDEEITRHQPLRTL